MISAAAFPGLNSLLKSQNRFRLLPLPEVQSRISIAQAFLASSMNMKVDLIDFLKNPTATLYSQENVSLTAMITSAIQMGVWDRIRKNGVKIDWVVGCSLGDVSRAIAGGACAFETALKIPFITLQNNVEVNNIGSNCAILTSIDRPFSTEDLAWFEKQKIDISEMSDRMLNASGRHADLEIVKKQALLRRWKVCPLIDFPVHSRHLFHYNERVKELLASLIFSNPSTELRIYSSLNVGEVNTGAEVCSEFSRIITSPLHWKASIRDLVKTHQVKRFINIGPCDTLRKLIHEHNLGVEVIDAETLLV